MMGGEEGGEQKGGALTVRPTTSLVPSSPAAGAIQKTEETGSKGNTLLVIKTKLVSIDTILKGTLAAEKKAEDVKRKAQERSERKEDEKELEDDSKEGKKAQKFKLAPPKQVLSFWEKIKSFFGKVLLGWLAVRLIDWLPKLMPIVKFLAKAADFIIKVGGFLLNGLVTFIDWGYKAVEGTRGFVKKLFGDAGVKGFDGIAGTLTTVFNLIGAIALASLAFGNENKRQNKNRMGDDLDVDPKTKKKVKPDEIVDPKTKKVRKKTNLEIENQKKYDLSNKQLDEVKLKKKKINPQTGKKFTNADAIADVKKPKGFAKFFGGVKDLGGKGLKLAGKGVKGALKLGKGLLNSLPNFSQLGDELAETLGNSYNTLKKTAQKRYDQVVDVAKKLKGKYDNALKSAGSYLSGLGEKAKQAFFEKVLAPVKKLLEPLVKKIQPIGDKIMGVLKKIPGYDKITKVLQKFGGAGSEGLMKKLGGKAIPILGGVVNMAFAYDRLASGDSVGGLIEGLSGLLDLSALVGNAAGPGISMGLDAYMFARDFVPQIQGAEDAVVSKLGLMGLKTNMDEIFAKLPGLGEITKMITGGDKKEKTEGEKITTKTTTLVDNRPGEMQLLKSGKRSNIEEALYNMRLNASGGTGEGFSDMVGNEKYAGDVDLIMEHGLDNVIIEGGRVTLKGNAENILPLDVNSVSKKATSVSESATYEDGAEETIIVKSGSQEAEITDDNTGEKESLVAVVAGGGGGGDSEVGDLLYKGG
jgi:hypothetical protein